MGIDLQKKPIVHIVMQILRNSDLSLQYAWRTVKVFYNISMKAVQSPKANNYLKPGYEKITSIFKVKQLKGKWMQS